MRAILKGERDPAQLAGLRDRRIQAREQELVESLRGNWKEDALFELQPAVDAYDFHQAQMAQCDERLQEYLAALPAREVREAAEGAGVPVAGCLVNKVIAVDLHHLATICNGSGIENFRRSTAWLESA